MLHLYEAAATRSGGRILVDSSKTPAHGFMLQSAGLADMRVIHLVRNPCAVIHSQSRSKARPETGAETKLVPRRNLMRSVLGWTKANILAERLSSASSRSVRVRYEDVVSQPEEALIAIRKLADVPVSEAQREPGQSELPTGRVSRHDIAGNPARVGWRDYEQSVAPDMQWQESMPPLRRGLVTVLTYPMLRRYKYL